MHEYEISVLFWIQTQDEADEAKTKLVEVLAQRDLNEANVSGWDVVSVDAVS